jgi:hypothetical protein
MVVEKILKTKDDLLRHYDMLVWKEHMKTHVFVIHLPPVKHVRPTFQKGNMFEKNKDNLHVHHLFQQPTIVDK